ncbi:hypothetical protein QBC38DRAFT_462666, partial [Podospora fimiseda]
EYGRRRKTHEPRDLDSVFDSLRSQVPSVTPAPPEHARTASSIHARSAPVQTKYSSSARGITTNVPPVRYAIPEVEDENPLASPNLLRAQIGATARRAALQYQATRTPFINPPSMSGAGGQPPRRPPPPTAAAPGFPDDDSSHSSSDEDLFSRRNPRASRRDQEPLEDALAKALRRMVQKSSPAPFVANPIHMEKPPKFDGKDISKFKPWWMKVEAYIETYETSFATDQQKINWVGSLLIDHAAIFHQNRVKQTRLLGLQDNWTIFVEAITKRFTNPAAEHVAFRKMKELKYKGDTQAYITELQDLNEDVRWSGPSLQDLVCRALPAEITRMVYSRRSGLPKEDDEFFLAIQEAGIIHENIAANPGISASSGKGTPVSTQEHLKSGRPQGKEQRSASGPSPSSKKEKDEKKTAGKKTSGDRNKVWSSTKEALKGVDQQDVDHRKSVNASCWRCGRENHHTTACFARKDINDKELPPAPGRVSSAKRKRTDDDDLSPPPSRSARANAATVQEGWHDHHAAPRGDWSDAGALRTCGTKRASDDQPGTRKKLRREPIVGS